MFQGAHLGILQKKNNRYICLIRDKSAYATSQMCPLKQQCASSQGGHGGHRIGGATFGFQPALSPVQGDVFDMIQKK